MPTRRNMNVNHNPNCDGSHCTKSTGEVRLFPFGVNGNGILCSSCFAYENEYRRMMGVQYGQPNNWPLVPWECAVIYDNAISEAEGVEFPGMYR